MTRTICSLCSFIKDINDNSANIHDRAKILLRCTVDQLNVHAADVLVLESQDKPLKYCEGRGFNDPAFQKSPFHFSLAQQVVQGRALVYLKDLAKIKNELKYSEDLVTEGFKTFVGTPLVAGTQLIGVLEIFHRDFLQVNSDWFGRLEEIARDGASALGNAMEIRHLRSENQELARAYDQTIEGWARALELRDYEPKGHTLRVTEMTVEFARVLGIPEPALLHIRRGAMLHDLGKMGIPDSILLKRDSLTDEEWIIMRRHPMIAFEQLASVEFLQPALDIPHYHHEKWDGTGYPNGLAGEQIPLAARLFSLVDVWDSLSSDRPYRKAWPHDKVLAHLRDRGGKQFDPHLMDMFVKLLEQGLKQRKSMAQAGTHREYAKAMFKI